MATFASFDEVLSVCRAVQAMGGLADVQFRCGVCGCFGSARDLADHANCVASATETLLTMARRYPVDQKLLQAALDMYAGSEGLRYSIARRVELLNSRAICYIVRYPLLALAIDPANSVLVHCPDVGYMHLWSKYRPLTVMTTGHMASYLTSRGIRDWQLLVAMSLPAEELDRSICQPFVSSINQYLSALVASSAKSYKLLCAFEAGVIDVDDKMLLGHNINKYMVSCDYGNEDALIKFAGPDGREYVCEFKINPIYTTALRVLARGIFKEDCSVSLVSLSTDNTGMTVHTIVGLDSTQSFGECRLLVPFDANEPIRVIVEPFFARTVTTWTLQIPSSRPNTTWLGPVSPYTVYVSSPSSGQPTGGYYLTGWTSFG